MIKTGLPEFTNDGNKVANADHTYIVGSSCRGKSVIIKEMYDKIYKKDKKLIILIISPSLNTPTFKKIKADNIKLFCKRFLHRFINFIAV